MRAAARSRSPPRRIASTASPAEAFCWSTTRPASRLALKVVEAGFAPQLPLEGAILQNGGFGAARGRATELEYWRLTGAEPPGERCPIDSGDAGALIDRIVTRVKALIDHFDDPSTPYLAVPSPRWAPRFSDYRHLERLAESEAEE